MKRTQTNPLYPVALALGAGIAGAALGLLLAPHSGRRTRRHLKRLPGEVQHQLEDWYEDLEECVDDFKGRLDETLVQGRQVSHNLRREFTDVLDSSRKSLARRVEQVRRPVKMADGE